MKNKIISASGLKVKIRSHTCDENFVKNVILNKEYYIPGYEINDNDTIVDIGGNIGTFALLAASCSPNGKVFTFEPSKENFSSLTFNIKLNGFKNIFPVKHAIYGEKRKMKLFLTHDFRGGNTIVPQTLYPTAKEKDEVNFSKQTYEIVDCITLEDVFRSHNIIRCNFLKLDCEGAEFSILFNTSKKLFKKIDKIAMEHHSREYAPRLVSHLKANGFIIDRFVDYKDNYGFIFAKRN